jgi:hypothetical protein
MIILKNGDLEVIHDEYQGYAVFKRVRYPSGTTSHWQQLTKWYRYKKYAIDYYMKRSKGEI